MTRCTICACRTHDTNKSGICAPCLRIQSQGEPGPEHALTGGRWVPGRWGVVVWREDAA